MVEIEIVARLKSFAGVANLISTSGVARIDPVVLTEETYPAITHRRISGVREATISDANVMATFQLELSCWGVTWTDARTLADQVRQALDGYSSNNLQLCSASDGPDLYEPEAPPDGAYRCIVQLETMYVES